MLIRNIKNFKRIIGIGCLLLCVNTVSAQVIIPDTPVGDVLSSMLEAMNSQDVALLEKYYQTHQPDQSAVNMMPFIQQTGGFDLISIEKSAPLNIEVIVKERNSEIRAFGALSLSSPESKLVSGFQLRAIPAGASLDNSEINASTREEIINTAITHLNENYVFPEVAANIEQALKTKQANGEYDAISDAAQFSRLLTQHMRDIYNDLHLSINYSPIVRPAVSSNTPAARPLEQISEQIKRTNCGFERVEHMPGNIGYLKFNGFMSPTLCQDKVAAAMNFLQDVDTLIIDLRQNGGGDPAMVAHISSYLFEESTHLNDLWTRSTDHTEEYWTLDEVPGAKLIDVPVYILTSARTFSGAEEFAYNLKSLERATIIGETTGGGAHPIRPHIINDRFTINVPFARAINPITLTNWEGVGVEPDVNVTAQDALDTALTLARE